MAANTNTIATITQENKTFYDRALLKRLTGSLVFSKYGQKRTAPKHEGGTVNFRRVNSIAAPVASLSEGVTPDGVAATVTAVTATVAQEGSFVTVSDVIDTIGIDPMVTELTDVMAEQAAERIDNVIKDIIFAGTTVQYVGQSARANITAANVLTGNEVKKAVRTLRNNKAKPIKDGYYIGFIDPSVQYDLMSDTLWQDVSKYNGGEKIMKGEIGKIHGVKFIDITNAFTATGAAGAVVHATLIIGQEAYGIVDIEGSSKPEMIVKPLGSGDDPLNQRATIGWKAFFTAKRLQELAMVRIESGVSA